MLVGHGSGVGKRPVRSVTPAAQSSYHLKPKVTRQANNNCHYEPPNALVVREDFAAPSGGVVERRIESCVVLLARTDNLR